MSNNSELRVPDIGDFDKVDVIEVLVSAGDEINEDDPLITLETDKAAMDVPATRAGKIKEMKVSSGDKVSKDSLILILEAAEESSEDSAQGEEQDAGQDQQPREETAAAKGRGGYGGVPEQASRDQAAGRRTQKKAAPAAGEYDGEADIECELVVLGSGPGGYTAAFRAADLGKDVTLVESYPSLGGVCLNVGCIPSKALLHVAKVMEEAAYFGEHGVKFGKPKIDTDTLRQWKDDVVGRLTGGIKGLAKRRNVNVVIGRGSFISPHHLEIDTGEGFKVLRFEQAIIAAGSEAATLPNVPDDPRIMNSTKALEIEELPQRMLIVGGGIIGLEIATVYSAMGVEVSVAEMTGELMPGADRDLVKPFEKRIRERYDAVMLNTKVGNIEAQKRGLKVTFEGENARDTTQTYGRILVAIGRRPNGSRLAAEKSGVIVDERGFVPVNNKMQTNVEHIFAIGDVAREPLLAHKATHEGKVAAEVASGEKSAFDARVIPSVAYTDPEIAWVGVTEIEAKQQSIDYGKGSFPWAANGRSLAMGRDEGMTKILFDKKTGRAIGGGIVGPGAGDLISELALAIEMGCDAEDIALTIHPHPTLSETVTMAAEAYAGTLTDLYAPRKK